MTETLKGEETTPTINYNARMRAGTPPRPPRIFLPRPLLWERLDKATEGAVSLLSAPVGAGKTLGVSGWVRDRFAVDNNHPDRPEAYWIDADASWDVQRLRRMLDGSATADDLSRGGVRNGDHRRQPLLVIDDAHKLPTATLRMLQTRLNQDPGSLRVLLLSRWDLLLTNVVPQLMGDLTVIRGDVLKLTPDEARTLITQHSGVNDPELVAAISARAEGWCAAVVLAARAVGASSNPMAAANRFARGDARFADRIASEVLSALSRRERHLLLSVACEGRTTPEVARQLSRDPGAADLLAGLAETGLLVTRVSESVDLADDYGSPGHAAAESYEHQLEPLDLDGQDENETALYRIHPLLSEVIRRRLTAGGVDVEQARATVTRAVRLDLARGKTDRAFDRLFAMNRPVEAVELLSTTGVTLLSTGQQAGIHRFVKSHLELIDRDPTTWFPIVVERWQAGDSNSARHWLERLRQCSDTEVGSLVMASAALMRARIGLESVESVVEQAQRLVSSSVPIEHGPKPPDKAVLPRLLISISNLQNWLGDLGNAEVNLTTAITLSRDRGLPLMQVGAISQLALTQLMAGREHVSYRLAMQALDLMPEVPPTMREQAAERAAAAALIARSVDLPVLDKLPESLLDRRRDPQRTDHIRSDSCSRFWIRMSEARVLSYQDSPTAAEELLSTPFEASAMPTPLPEHLLVLQQVERSVLAALTGNGETLAEAEQMLRARGIDGEAQLVAGLRADLNGDRRAAAELFGSAAGSMKYPQYIHRALALTCQAQLLDALGEHDRALELLVMAATETAARRNASPFLGWSRQGTPIQTLLEAARAKVGTEWLHELADSRREQPDLTAAVASVIATQRELDNAAPMVVAPVLSPRERDVLRELARGSTYADIGADLFVSENTVKTHVSHLYAKLGATRRSEALAVARGLRLL